LSEPITLSPQRLDPGLPQLYDAVLEALPDTAVFLTDLDGANVSWNGSVERVFGYAEHQWLGRSASLILTAEDWSAGKAQQLLHGAANGRVCELCERVRQGGERFTAEVTVVPCLGEDGNRIAFLNLVKRVTAPPEIQDSSNAFIASEMETKRRLIMNAAPAIMSYLDLDLRYRFANDAYERWFGVRAADLIGKSIFDLFDSETGETIKPQLQRVLSGEVVTFEADFTAVAGRTRTLQVTYTPDLDGKGDVQGLFVLGSDITARRNAERALQESERKQAALVALGDYLRDSRDEISMISAAMEIVGKTLNIARAGYGKVDASGEYVTIEKDWTNDSVPTLVGTYRFEDFGTELGARLRRGESIVIPDVASSEITAEKSEQWKAIQITSVINLPILENGRLAAILFLHDTFSRLWSDADLTFIRKVADRTWAAAERAHALLELQQSEEFTRRVLESSPDSVKVLDLEGRLLSINQRGCEVLEIEDPDAYLRKPWSSLWGEHKEIAENAVTEARAGRTATFQALCPTVGGTPKFWDVVVTPIHDGLGRPMRILSLSRDITERRSAEQERERLTRELQRSNEELSQFAHIVSHDLQTPIRGVSIFAQLLRKKGQRRLLPEDLEYLDQIDQSAERMHELVRGLLHFAQVGQGQLDVKPVDMGQVVGKAIQSLQVQIEEQSAQVVVGVLPPVQGDAVQLIQLLQNLISNALKYHRVNEPPQISIAGHREKSQTVFSVTDNGQGIAPEYQTQIFEPLKRLHGEEVPGTGLGLAVCYRIVQRHGGRIWVESQPKTGSTFFFTLPS
jgi:PAS domain S-box-containing protein